MYHKKTCNGFTIIELLITLAILGIIIGIAIPKIDHTDFYLKTQGRLLCTEIRSLRFLEMTEGLGHKISLDKHYYKVADGIIDLKKVALPPNYKLLYYRDEIGFTYNGVPTYGGTTIRIVNTKNNKYISITIMPASGRILLKDKICVLKNRRKKH